MPSYDRKKINHQLRKLGFGDLDDPTIIQQIAFCIRDHAHFRGGLFSVEPAKRKLAYESLRPHLSFAAKPLDVYEAEMREMAERNQLPQYNPITDELIPMKVGEVRLNELAEEAIAQNRHEKEGGKLELVCTHCLEFENFPARTRKDALKTAQSQGWRWAERNGAMKVYCPKHVPGRLTMTLACRECNKEENLRAWDEQDGYTSARVRGWVIESDAMCPECAVKQLVLQ